MREAEERVGQGLGELDRAGGDCVCVGLRGWGVGLVRVGEGEGGEGGGWWWVGEFCCQLLARTAQLG